MQSAIKSALKNARKHQKMSASGSNDNEELYTEDFIFGKQVLLKQLKKGYRFGSDAVLLASYINANKSLLLDLGAGVGAVSLGVAWRNPECQIVAVEKDPEISGLLLENIAANGMSKQVTTEHISIEHLPKDFESYFDHVIANPPFHKHTGTRSTNRHRNLAHIGDGTHLTDWLKHAVWACRSKGYVSFMIRADRTDEVISFLNASKMGEVTLYPIWPVEGNPANRIIVSARKDSKTGSILLPGITLHNTDGSLTSNASLAMKGLGIER